MSRLESAVRDGSEAFLFRAITRGHLDAVLGTEHIPAEGPFILVANHSSFADHFIVGTVMLAVRGQHTRFLTKAESFATPLKRFWHTSLGCIPVQRDGLQRETLAAVSQVLGAGEILCIYPEGTRGPGWPLLPFKDGAFLFASRGGCPVVPVAILGASQIMPKGAWWFRPGRIRVMFGPALSTPDGLPNRERIRVLRDEARGAIEGLLTREQDASGREDRLSGRRLAAQADALVEELADSATPPPTRGGSVRVRRLLTLAAIGDPGDPRIALTRARLRGLRAMASAMPLKPVLGLSLGGTLRGLARSNPEVPLAHYMLARWQLAMPRLVGGGATAALAGFRRAQALDPSDSRFPMGAAEALLKASAPAAAAAVLEQVIALPASDLRTARRRARALHVRQGLPGALAETAPGEPLAVSS